MFEKKKIGVWGQFGDGGKIADGQAVRTTIITNELKMRYGHDSVNILNTNQWTKHPFSFLFNSIKLFLKSEKIIILPADNGFKVIVILYNFLSIMFKREIYDIVIGGYLPSLLYKKRYYVEMLAKYKALFVQTPNIKKDLEKIGLKNVYILSNPKRLNTRKEHDLIINKNKNVSVCVFSRVSKDKGIIEAINAVKMTNDILGGDYIKLDIYGLILKDFEDRFYDLLKENQDFVKYKGIVDYDKTVETLSNYFVLLFPTYFHGEGFPGSMIDSFNTGIPIIATDWLYNKDVIHNGINGILVPIKDTKALSNALLDLYNNREKALEISKNNLKEAEKYKPDEVMSILYKFLDK
ncbi:glycosyltransferase family 4 protein [Clostridium perfringens]|uniref:glycosyltransferase family 4 protein n=1 Tax=Clostridium perfringens TaxID=1502 RepID=UPI0018E42D83|nr:glycosyltransferase family 4 protein [Clostridium perfringens]ELC8413680.1 glycosyltransferase family 4 protein [Clostridium perfringens]MBI6007231.1 glycosyltransferase family 4 protein [Clostridium perfringens]MDM0605560.1 glycosyltransferase family 4 protein [Clostridium perfringens]MDM0638774.1 glycosyltransferase family 4 protein [Clostridium perfringens]HAT4166204.1 glycosyltransferase family 4 protein [Clostridium perfringens]